MLDIKRCFGKNAILKGMNLEDDGSYVTVTGDLKRMDTAEGVMSLTDGTGLPLDDIIDIKSE